MSRVVSRLLPAMALGCLLASLAAVPLRAQDYGRIAGRVTSTDTRAGLAGAKVVLVGTAYGTVTGEDGHFLLPRVPVGTHTIRVLYLGRASASQEVTVAASQTADVELQMSPITLDAVIVEGVRAQGQAEALSRQQNAPNITNVVAADQMGRFPDASAPEAVQRLPGIALQRDMGEGRYIAIRGGSAANTQVTVNGEQVPSPEGEVRQVALDAVPVSVLEAIEVAKAITPDMDAEAIGGSVNLVTKKAPDQPVMAFEGAGGYASIREGYSGSGSATIGRRTRGGTFGYLISGSYSRRNFGADDLESSWDIGDPGAGDDALEELEVRDYTTMRARTGGTAAFDWRVNDGTTLYLTSLYSELRDDEQRRNFVHVVEDGELEFRHKNRLELTSTLNVAAGGEHLLLNGVGIDYRVTATRSEQERSYDNEIMFLREGVTFAPDISNPDEPQTNPAGGVAGTYLFDEIEPSSGLTNNDDYVGALNVAFPYTLGETMVGSLKIGVKYRDKKKTQNVTESAYELTDVAPDIVLGEDIGGPYELGDYNNGDYSFPGYATSPGDVNGFPTRYASSLEFEQNVEEETNDYEITERTSAAYVMTELNLTPELMVLPGVRYEHTTFTGAGFEYDGDTEVLTPTRAENDYGRFFPMIHARYRIGTQTNVRAAFTTAIQRPNFVELVPYRVRDGEDLTLGNPNLTPTTSQNYDLLFEHYDRRIGVMSAGVFYKRLQDPIFISVVQNTGGGETTQPFNSESGRIHGVEFALQQQLSFLPAPFDGLGVYGNYTYTQSRATQPGGLRTRLPGQADHAWNAALSYEKRGFSGQVSLNFTGSALAELGGDTGPTDDRSEDVYIDERLQVDLSASYFVLPTTQLFLEATNLNNEPYLSYVGTRSRPNQIEYYEPALLVGLRFRP